MLKDNIRQLAESIHGDVITHRRFLHSNPELSFQEYQTSAFVKSCLEELGIDWHPLAGTGVVGLIKGDKPSDQVIALRGEMDALPITVENDVPYK